MTPDTTLDVGGARRALVGDPDDPALDRALEHELLRGADPITLHMAAVSSRVSPEFLQELWDSASRILDEVAGNPHCPLGVIGERRVRDVDDIVLAFYAHRSGRADLAFELLDHDEDCEDTVAERWRQIGGELPAPDAPLEPSGASEPPGGA